MAVFQTSGPLLLKSAFHPMAVLSLPTSLKASVRYPIPVLRLLVGIGVERSKPNTRIVQAIEIVKSASHRWPCHDCVNIFEEACSPTAVSGCH